MATKMRTIATTCVFSTIHNVHSIRADQLREEERTQFCHYCLTHFFLGKKERRRRVCQRAQLLHISCCLMRPCSHYWPVPQSLHRLSRRMCL
jgi:hypothetical protein